MFSIFYSSGLTEIFKINREMVKMENDNWVCVRPSGTEPKIKLYVASKADSQEAVDALNDKMTEEAKKLLA